MEKNQNFGVLAKFEIREIEYVLQGSDSMQIPIWKGSKCGNPPCIHIRVDLDKPSYCLWSSSKCEWVEDEMSIVELSQYVSKYFGLNMIKV